MGEGGEGEERQEEGAGVENGVLAHTHTDTPRACWYEGAKA